MPRLFIAEKPSLARAIAAVLPRPHQQQAGFIRCGKHDVVTWCVGHLLEQAQPEAYDAKYKKWQLADLPILPEQWLLQPRPSVKKQLNVIKRLIKPNVEIIHAGDPDREGQLLVDEVIDYLKVSTTQKAAARRLLINDLNPQAVKKSLSVLKYNREFIPLSVSALARSRADWLYGINLSRAYTLLGQQAGYQGVLSVGRVQTPILGLVVQRDEQIEKFIPHDYFVLDAIIPCTQSSPSSPPIRARWQPSEACEPWQDPEGRIIHRPLAENVAGRICNQVATLVHANYKKSQQFAPLPYSLSALQIDAARRYSLGAQSVLNHCQSLYEKHKLITYPRSDCRYLPHNHRQQAPQILQAISLQAQLPRSDSQHADLSLRSKAWNDSKVEAHHAIIPTAYTGQVKLSQGEQQVYDLIARQYLMQFYPAAQYAEHKLEFEIAGGRFIATGKQLLVEGWRELLHLKENDTPTPTVPDLKQGERFICEQGDIQDKKTEPAKSFTEASLLEAMTGIARFVKDPQLKKILKETDGLGTEATRAGILETLFKRSWLKREGKKVVSTAAGRAFVSVLPTEFTEADRTAYWESELQQMTLQPKAYYPFMAQLQQQIYAWISRAQDNPIAIDLSTLSHLQQPNYRKRKARKK